MVPVFLASNSKFFFVKNHQVNDTVVVGIVSLLRQRIASIAVEDIPYTIIVSVKFAYGDTPPLVAFKGVRVAIIIFVESALSG